MTGVQTCALPIFARRCGADVRVVETEWGTVFKPEQIEAALREHSPKLLAVCSGDTSTTMLQPLAEIGKLCHRYGALLQVDATASLAGAALPVDAWEIDAVTAGLQKCLAGPSGAAPITLNDAAAKIIYHRRHIEQGLQTADYVAGAGRIIGSNYFDLAMVMDYWSDKALNHHTEATTMLYGAHECARIFIEEGRESVYRRHRIAGASMLAGLEGMGLRVFGDRHNKMPNVTGAWIPEGVSGERVRSMAASNPTFGSKLALLLSSPARAWRTRARATSISGLSLSAVSKIGRAHV